MGGYKNIPKIEKLKLDDCQHLIKMCEYYINLFCENYKIDDITKISENRFKAALTYICNSYFKLSLYTDKKRAPAIDNVIDYTDIGQLAALLDSYIYICGVCDKIPSVAGFSCYTGIPQFSIYNWQADYKNLDIYNTGDIENNSDIDKCMSIYNTISNTDINSNNTIYNYEFINNIKSINDSSIYRKYLNVYRSNILNILINSKENALSDRLASGGAGQVGIIAILNHQYNWSGAAANITINTPTISLSDLPQLPASDNGTTASD